MNRTSWIVIAVNGGVCLLIGIFLLVPGLSRDWQTWRETQSAKKELAELNEKQKILGDLVKNPNLDKIMTAAGNYIPEEAKSSELILELSAIVAQSNMAIEQFILESATPTPAKEEGGTTTTQTEPKKTAAAETVGFTLKIAGTFGNLMDFFKLIETSSRLIVIPGLNLSQEQDKFTAEIKGETYWKKSTAGQTEKSLTNITVAAEILQKFQNLRQYSTPIDTSTEAGFGRTNPFENIK